MGAGNPGKYYIKPSKKLMSMAPEWRVVEHEDGIETITNRAAFKGNPIFIRFFSNNQAIGADGEYKDDDFSYIVNTDLLNDKQLRAETEDGVTTIYYPKIKGDDNKRKNVVKLHFPFQFLFLILGVCFCISSSNIFDTVDFLADSPHANNQRELTENIGFATEGTLTTFRKCSGTFNLVLQLKQDGARPST
ncbi:hypothetical protein MKW98_013908 [Papaver atlanticum]|uniref:Uncharacterized protein n=1 Tax=Papaver atlanticum TaxID=357466 RepID=A0AAD4SER9_9MAGN|nr:hypothetical protein MKW98_013908 [Papaver atlanticum]